MMMKRAEVAIPAGPAEDDSFVDARVTPTGSLENLSQMEVDRLLDSSRGGLYDLYRRCSLAVLNSGGETDDEEAKHQQPKVNRAVLFARQRHHGHREAPRRCS